VGETRYQDINYRSELYSSPDVNVLLCTVIAVMNYCGTQQFTETFLPFRKRAVDSADASLDFGGNVRAKFL
jgi:hypothetical protein